ncbi:hypothetical protein DSO57_1026241 [Entomophthora muscae]|uniref:Uncharacterized protein n=1 Tax=Entomophthora muscae TaxID=34485 RepID=A0ACC2UC25_9FUNG|nr:hypothetical protein DSO57_1026241 [Entomophthora muscae]
MRELEKQLKDLDSAIAEIKEIDKKIKEKALMAKIPDMSVPGLQTSNPGHDYLQAASLKDQEAICLCFFGIESPQAEAVNIFQDKDTSKNLGTTAPNGTQEKLPNRSKEIPTIILMSLKSILIANQDSPPDENVDLKAASITMTQEQKSKATLLKNPANECLP